jgi:hypothetical protein
MSSGDDEKHSFERSVRFGIVHGAGQRPDGRAGIIRITVREHDAQGQTDDEQGKANAKHGAGRRRYRFAGCSSATVLAR